MVFSTYEGAVLCKKCEQEEKETFNRIRDYLYDHPGISIQELSINLNLSVRRIEQFIRSGRLNIS
jgi:predicted transcriptional regulator